MNAFYARLSRNPRSLAAWSRSHVPWRIVPLAILVVALSSTPASAQFNDIFRALKRLGGAEPDRPAEIADAVAVEMDAEVPVSESEEISPLKEFAPVVQAGATLEMQDGKLRVAEISPFNQFQQALYSNSHLFGGGGSSSSGSNNRWDMRFNWQSLDGNATLEQAGETSSLSIEATEATALQRSLHYRVSGESNLDLTVWSPKIPEYLQLQQDATRLRIVYLQGRSSAQASGDTVSEVLRQVPATLRTEIVSRLRTYGLPLPATPYDPAVVQRVLARLGKPLDQAESQAFRGLVAGFDDPDFEVRQQTSAQVAAEFERWRTHIARALDDDSFSLEARSRLRAVFREQAESEEANVVDLLASTQLDQNAEYLVWLLNEAQEEADWQRIMQRLQEISDNDLPLERDAWVAWGREAFDSSQVVPAEPPEPAPADALLGDDRGPLNRASKLVKRLARIEISGTAARLDEQVWREALQGRTIKEISDEVEATLSKYQLPSTVWQGESLVAMGEAAYPVARFLAIQPEAQQLPQPEQQHHHHYYGNSGLNANPSFYAGGIFFRLNTRVDPNVIRRMQQAQGRPVVHEQQQNEIFYSFSLHEKVKPHRQLAFGSAPDTQRFYWGFRDPEAQIVIAWAGSPQEGWILHDSRAGRLRVLSGETMDALFQEDPDYFKDELFPFLETLGFDVLYDELTSATSTSDASSTPVESQESPVP